MLRKVVVGVSLAGLIGVLVFGAINRTAARYETGEGRGSGSSSRNGGEAAHPLAFEERRGARGGLPSVGSGSGRVEAQLRQGEEADSPQYRAGIELSEVEGWQTLEGTVLRIDEAGLLIALDEGEEMLIDGRAWRFLQQNGLPMFAGDSLLLTGFYEGDAFEVALVQNLTSGQALALREQSGRPLWSG